MKKGETLFDGKDCDRVLGIALHSVMCALRNWEELKNV